MARFNLVRGALALLVPLALLACAHKNEEPPPTSTLGSLGEPGPIPPGGAAPAVPTAPAPDAQPPASEVTPDPWPKSADADGIFEVELHGSGAQIASLEVQPG